MIRDIVSAPITSARRDLTGANELIGDDERVQEAGARGFETERRRTADPELLLHEASHVREDQIRRRGADEHEVDVGGREPGVLDRREPRFVREVARRFVVGRDVPVLDAGPRANPFVGGIDHLLEIEVGQNLLRQILAGADDARIH